MLIIISLLSSIAYSHSSDETETVVHSNDIDAPVILLVPHSWHLEDKEPQPINLLPSPSPSLPSPSPTTPTTVIPTTALPSLLPTLYKQSLSAPSGDTQALQQLAASLPSDLTHLTILTSNSNDIPIVLASLNRPVCAPIITAAAGQFCYCIPQVVPSTKRISWRSRSCWCPPPIYEYSTIGVSGRYFSIPAVLPVQPDHLLYTSASMQEAMEVVGKENLLK